MEKLIAYDTIAMLIELPINVENKYKGGTFGLGNL